jgi:hypothetical protein
MPIQRIGKWLSNALDGKYMLGIGPLLRWLIDLGIVTRPPSSQFSIEARDQTQQHYSLPKLDRSIKY